MSWYISDSEDLTDIICFLEKDEWKHIQVLSEFCSKSGYIYPNKSNVLTIINKEANKVTGLIQITSKGLIYPIFLGSTLNCIQSKKELIKILATINFKIHGIIGLKDDVDFLDSIVFRRIRGINNYILLHRKSLTKFTSNPALIIKKADIKDLNKLVPLEFEYQIEEVLLKPEDLNRRATLENFKNKLKNDDIYFILDKNFPITKGGTTYKSSNYTLIGGVFTWKEKRNSGYSTILLKHLLNEQLQIGYKGALFVKDDNSAALHLYKKLGFIDPLKYKINYYYN